MSGLESLRLFGIVTPDRVGKVHRELDDFVDGDAIFVDHPPDAPSLRAIAAVLSRFPAYFVGSLLVRLLFYAPLYVLLVRDVVSAELVAARRVGEDRDLPLHRVGERPSSQLRDVGTWFVVGNWLVLAAVVAVGNPLAVGATSLLALVGNRVPMDVRRRGHRWAALGLQLVGLAAAAATVATGLLSMPLFIGCTATFLVASLGIADDRRVTVLDRIDGLAADSGYTNAVLVTDVGHLQGFVRTAERHGVAVPRIHVSAWLGPGETGSDPTDVSLPAVGISDGSGGTVQRVVAGSERTVLKKRLAAAVLDFVLASGAATVVLLSIGSLAHDAGIADQPIPVVVGLSLASLTWFGYYVGQETRRNRTWGKARFGLAVAGVDGGSPSPGAVLLRNLLRPVDVWLFGVGGVLMLIDDRQRRLGDLAGRTVVGRADAEAG